MNLLFGITLSAVLGCNPKAVIDYEYPLETTEPGDGDDPTDDGTDDDDDIDEDIDEGTGGDTDDDVDEDTDEDTDEDIDEEPTGPVDEDGDGYTADEDCDDADPDSFPGGEETDDGADNDCDGFTDEIDVCDGDVGGFAADYDTIQGAINGADDGATVVVCAGIYEENLELSNRRLTLVAPSGAQVTRVVSADGAGVVSISGGDVAIEGFTLQAGTAPYGGGVFCENADLALVSNRVLDNVALRDGGGIYASRCDLDASNNDISGNTAAAGGGGGVAVTGGVVHLLENEVYGNSALEGGGIHVTNGNQVTLEGNAIYENEATTTSEETYGTGSGGGGVLYRGDGDIIGNEIYDNTSGYNGGGLYILYESTTIEDNVFRGNYSGEDGAGAYANQPQGVWRGNVFEENTANDDAGGLRIYVGRVTVEDNEFIGNSAVDDAGGMKLSHSSNTIRNNTFTGNSAGDAGGGLELDNDTSDVSGCTFTDNTAARGAGLHTWRVEGRITISDSTFTGNEASGCGGAIEIDNNPYLTTLSHLWIEGNRALDGAGICTEIFDQEDEIDDIQYEASEVVVVNTVLTDNYASDDGGGLYLKASETRVVNVVIHDNRGDGSGGGIAVKEETAITVVNAVISDNTGAGIYQDSDGTITVSYSDVDGNTRDYDGSISDQTNSNGNVSEDPRFSDPGAGDFTLDVGSPCINAGDPGIDDADGSRSDMGAHGGPDGS